MGRVNLQVPVAGVLPVPGKGVGVDTGLSQEAGAHPCPSLLVVQVNAPFYKGRNTDLKGKCITQNPITNKQ